MVEIERHAIVVDQYVGAYLELNKAYLHALSYVSSTGDITEPGVVSSSGPLIEDINGNPVYDLRMELDKLIGFVPNAIRRQSNFRNLLEKVTSFIEKN